MTTLKIEESKVDDFLRELTALSYKYGIVIGGCGCCESPFLSDLTPTQENLQYSVYGSGYLGLHSVESIEEDKALRAQEREWWGEE